MARYEEALDSRQRRLNELIDEKISGELSAEEEIELAELRADLERPFGTTLMDLDTAQEAVVQREEGLLTELRTIAEQS